MITVTPAEDCFWVTIPTDDDRAMHAVLTRDRAVELHAKLVAALWNQEPRPNESNTQEGGNG